jgi:hypothetical protein
VTRRSDVLLVALASLAAAVLFTWPLATDAGGSVVSYTDVLYNSWVLGWVADRTGHGLRGLWSAPVFFPYPDTLGYVDPLLGIGVPLAPVYWLTGNAVLLHNVATWLSFPVTATGAYVLGRDRSGSRAGGVVAAAVAAFIPYRLSHLVHVQVLMVGWLWWAAWSVHRYFAEPGWKAAARIAVFYVLLGMSSLYWAYIGLVPLAVIAAVEYWRRRPKAVPLIRHAVCAAAIVGAVFLPVATRLAHVTSSDSPLMLAQDSRMNGADLTAFGSGRPSLLVWGGVLAGPPNGEADLFPGLTVLVCAIAALLALEQKNAAASWIPVYVVLMVIGIVLSLGPAITMGGRVLMHDPIFGWLNHVPGFDKLRAAARFAVIAQLALSVLAALGVAAWLQRRSPSPGEAGITAGLLAALVFVEGLGVPLDLRRFSPYLAQGDRQASFWLARHPGGAVLDLPFEGWSDSRYGIYYQYRTLLHGHPIVNGVGRWQPPLLAMLGDPDSPLYNPSRARETTTLLKALGVRYVVLHRKWFEDDALADAMRSAFSDVVGPPPAEFGESTIVDLGESSEEHPVPAPEVQRELLAVSASRGDASAMVDGNPRTRWLSGGPQDGTEWIEVGLAATLPVTGVRLLLTGRSLNDYPRTLAVDVWSSDGRAETVVASSVLPQLGAGLRAEPAKPAIELRWPPRPVRMLRLRQTGRSARWYWSVHELDVLSAAQH